MIKNMLQKWRKWAVVVACGLLGVVPALAEDNANLDLSAVTAEFTSWKTTILAFIQSNLGTISAILAGFLGITFLFLFVKWIKRGSSRS